MYELIYLAFERLYSCCDLSVGRENGVGQVITLARAVGFDSSWYP